jgi:hypothetical protein
LKKGKTVFYSKIENTAELCSTPLYCELDFVESFYPHGDMADMTDKTDMTDMTDVTNMTDMSIVLFGFVA